VPCRVSSVNPICTQNFANSSEELSTDEGGSQELPDSGNGYHCREKLELQRMD